MINILKKHLKKKIVVDTKSSWVYIGTLDKIMENCLVLKEVDVHDNRDTATSKERYILDSRTSGIKSNREKVYINLDYVVSFSLINEVKYF